MVHIFLSLSMLSRAYPGDKYILSSSVVLVMLQLFVKEPSTTATLFKRPHIHHKSTATWSVRYSRHWHGSGAIIINRLDKADQLLDRLHAPLRGRKMVDSSDTQCIVLLSTSHVTYEYPIAIPTTQSIRHSYLVQTLHIKRRKVALGGRN